MIYDVIIVAIFLILIIVSAYRGIARSLARLISLLLAYAISTPLGRLLSTWIYQTFVRPEIDKAVTSALSTLATGNVKGAVDSIPAWLGALLKGADVDISSFSSLVQDTTAVCNAVSDAVQPVATGVVTALATAVLFLLLLIVFRLLITKPLVRAFDLPGLRGVNHLLGALIGVIDAFLLVSLLAYLLKLLLPHIQSGPDWLNERTIYNSFIFYHFYSGNIFTAVLRALGLSQ